MQIKGRIEEIPGKKEFQVFHMHCGKIREKCSFFKLWNNSHGSLEHSPKLRSQMALMIYQIVRSFECILHFS